MKTAFVTGASAGFGKAICRALIADNYRVIGGARRADNWRNWSANWASTSLP